MKKTILLLVFAFLGLSTANAQVGIGTTKPENTAALDVVSSEKGFLPPRMDTNQRDAINGGDIAPGLVIYNTDVHCLQWYDGTDWFDPCEPPVATFTSTNCNTNSTGTKTIDTPVSGVTQTITLDVETVGDYTITTDEVAGVTFSASGSFTSTGTQDVVLTASGTPTAEGTVEYNVLNCFFTRSIAPLSVNTALASFSSNGCNSGGQGAQDLRVTGWTNNGSTFSLSAGDYSLNYSVPITARGRVYSTDGGQFALVKELRGKLLVRIRNTATGQTYLTSSGNRVPIQGCLTRGVGSHQATRTYSNTAPTETIPAGTYQIEVYGESWFGGCSSWDSDRWGGCGLSSSGGGSINITAE